MLIRNMNEDRVINTEFCECIFIEKQDNNYTITARIRGEDMIIAKFRTEEEAKKALELIFTACGGGQPVFWI